MVSNGFKNGEGCPPDLAIIDSISGKWTVLVIYLLNGDTRRFGELQRMVPGISQKVLTQTLRKLERDGIVIRKVYPVVPPQVDYTLTPLGKSLTGLLSNMCLWAREHFEEVNKARIKYEKHSNKKTASL